MASDPMAFGSRGMVSPEEDDESIAVTDDMVVDITLQPDHDREQTLAFKYVNKEKPMPCCVGVILAQKGQIVYCGVAGATPWHGSFESVVVRHRQGLILKFHWKGKQPWPETRVRQDGDGVWRGLDYRCMEGGDDAYTR